MIFSCGPAKHLFDSVRLSREEQLKLPELGGEVARHVEGEDIGREGEQSAEVLVREIQDTLERLDLTTPSKGRAACFFF